MPYPRKQAVAIFLDIKRRKGKGAARKFGRKHRSDFVKKNAPRP
jgi:hypothetical protein